MHNKEGKVFLVLGMHRSATSFIARALHKMGVKMYDQEISATKGNKEGHAEDVDFVRLNEKMLADMGASWSNPPTEDVVHNWTKKEAHELVKAKAEGQKMWGWKDPRTSLLLPVYQEALEGDVYLIACFRKPQKVAESLHARDGMPLDKAKRLAEDYNYQLIQNIKTWLHKA